MRILVIGGTRFVGYHVVKRLLAGGHDIVVFNRGKSQDDFGSSVERFNGDRRDDALFFKIFHKKNFDAVIDVIGYKSRNIETSVRVFDGMIGHYLFISSGQVYLVTENRHVPSREEDFDQPLIKCPEGEEDAWKYGVGKRECETILMRAHQNNGFPMTILRLPIIHGPRDHTLRTYSYLLRLQDGGPIILPDGGTTVIRHIYIGDVANTATEILNNEKTKGQVYNLTQSEVLDLKSFIELCASIMKRGVKFVETSIAEIIKNGLDISLSPFTSRWVSLLDPSKAERELNFKSTPIRDWLKSTIDWFTGEYKGEKPGNYGQRSREIEFSRSLMSAKE